MSTPQDSQIQDHTSYGLIFILLAVFTGLEIGASMLPTAAKVPALVLLAATKATLVLLYFMHLRTDSRLYAALFVVGLVLAVPLILIMATVMPALR